MILISLLGACLFGLGITQNLCHSDCLPFHCHGPDSTQCSKCDYNSDLYLGECKCKLGYFNSFTGDKCSLYSWDCEQATVAGDNSLVCLKCHHNRYLLFYVVMDHSVVNVYPKVSHTGE